MSEPDGEVLYENARSRNDERFEVERVMTAPSYEGVRLQLRNRDRSIEHGPDVVVAGVAMRVAGPLQVDRRELELELADPLLRAHVSAQVLDA